MRDHIAISTILPAVANYFYWNRTAFDIPICWSIRSIFDTLDGHRHDE